MIRTACAAAFATLIPLIALAQEAVGELTMTVDGEERPFVLIQDAPGANPGSRYSPIGGDVVLTLVGVAGDSAAPPEEADEVVELRFTAAEEGAEVRTGSVVSFTTRDEEGVARSRGGTAEVELEELTTEEGRVSASGTFTSQVPPTEETAATEIEGTFRTTMERDPIAP